MARVITEAVYMSVMNYCLVLMEVSQHFQNCTSLFLSLEEVMAVEL